MANNQNPTESPERLETDEQKIAAAREILKALPEGTTTWFTRIDNPNTSPTVRRNLESSWPLFRYATINMLLSEDTVSIECLLEVLEAFRQIDNPGSPTIASEVDKLTLDLPAAALHDQAMVALTNTIFQNIDTNLTIKPLAETSRENIEDVAILLEALAVFFKKEGLSEAPINKTWEAYKALPIDMDRLFPEFYANIGDSSEEKDRIIERIEIHFRAIKNDITAKRASDAEYH